MKSTAGWPAIEVGRRLRLVPPEGAPTASGRRDVVVARGAFGSGEHETTVACLEALEEIENLVGARVLDLGCGTGVLAIAALALGARSAVAVDVDPRAVTASTENCRYNGVADRVTLVHGTLDHVEAGARFEVVMANIPAAVLTAAAVGLVARAAPCAALVLSGILWEELYDVEKCYRGLGCSVVRRRMLDEYSLISLRAPACGPEAAPLRGASDRWCRGS